MFTFWELNEFNYAPCGLVLVGLLNVLVAPLLAHQRFAVSS